ncbi:rod shape-determining protein [Sporosarcina ureae]|uniref:rod shape-determining protein n=1 Tax=Sporosarcina ureae TaxID=1571 RepID=UPI0009DC5F2D|nr:hypothetical protein SporoP17a_05750 [Sporosarcina ureae]
MLCAPSGVTTLERLAVINAAKQAGTQYIFLIEKAFAAAIGSGLPLWEQSSSMVVDIGASTTEIREISLGGLIISHTICVAVNEMD